jgi:predicted ATPase
MKKENMKEALNIAKTLIKFPEKGSQIILKGISPILSGQFPNYCRADYSNFLKNN